ncbi:hypothetical protein ANABIO32_03010 [Rossellomorea marisflavi]|nr:hypothetical protein ANABIO32_03010 [Rossellomorea marisflavi]
MSPTRGGNAVSIVLYEQLFMEGFFCGKEWRKQNEKDESKGTERGYVHPDLLIPNDQWEEEIPA